MAVINALLILDGFGCNKETKGNAIAINGAKNVSAYFKKYPSTLIGASGEDVGLPDGQMGNSEVGHLNIGAGRKVYQELTRVSKSIVDGDFFTNQAFMGAMENAKQPSRSLHLMGLISDGGVHSHNTHLYALLKMAKTCQVERVFVHCFTDGRDVGPTRGAGLVSDLQAVMKELGVGKIATITGRFYAMDRDQRWDRVEKAYNNVTCGNGIKITDPVAIIEESYAKGTTDEFIAPYVVYENEAPVATFNKGDSMIFFNFRPDRAREITRAFIYEDFDMFERKSGYLAPKYVSLTQYDETFTGIDIAYPLNPLANTFGEYLAKLGKTQLRIAETEKYAHVTFFFNGNVEKPNAGEDRVLIPSPKIETYDLQPEMSAYEVTKQAVALILSKKYDVMILNFANCDMVGHTGDLDATIKAVDVVDECVLEIITAIKSVGGNAIITADHGNADKMLEADGSPFTAHTTNPVPFIVVNDKYMGCKLAEDGVLSDIVPTILDMMNVEQPKEMTGKSLIIH